MGSSCSLACSASASATAGSKGNLIYFVDESDEQRLCCYDLDYGRLTTFMPCPDNNYIDFLPCWIVLPQNDEYQGIMSKQSLDNEEECDQEDDQELDVIYSAKTPCLLFTYKNDGVYNLVDPFTKNLSTLDLPQLAGSAIYSAMDGWLVVHKTREELFLFNIFTTAEIQLPLIPAKALSFLNGLTLSSSPTSSDCMLFGITYPYDEGTTDILFCRLGDQEWTQQTFQAEFTPHRTAAIFHKGLFHSLGMNGALGVYDHNKQTWAVLSSNLKDDQLNFEVGQCFMLELDGKLLSVFLDRYYNYPREVLQLRDGMDGWEKAIDFGDGLLFVGRYGSILTSAPTEESKNSICLPKFEVEGEYQPVIINPWDHDATDVCFYGSIEYTLNTCWVMTL